MFIDERTRLVQKYILDELFTLTGSNAGEFHSEEVLMFRDNCQRAEWSSTFYCRELKLASWSGGAVSVSALFPSQSDREALWQALSLRCDLAEQAPSLQWNDAINVADLIHCLVEAS